MRKKERRKELQRRLKLAELYKKKIIEEAANLRGEHLAKYLGNKSINDFVERYDDIKKKCEAGIKELEPRLKIPLLLLFVSLIVVSLFFFRFQIIGFITREEVRSYVDSINRIIKENENFTWTPLNQGNITRIGVIGKVVGDGNAKIFLVAGNKKFLVYDSEKTGLLGITGLFVDEGNETVNVTGTNETTTDREINISLEYKEGSIWDIDDDGVEGKSGVIDLTVENTEFNFDYTNEKLCTRWETESVEDQTSSFVCYGNDLCCNFLSLLSSSANWNDAFNSFYGKYGATENNIIRVQVVNINESLQEIYSSEWAELKAVFLPETKFKDKCYETCLLNLNYTSFTFIVEVDNAFVVLDEISYSIKGIVANIPPVLVSEIDDMTAFKGSTVVIDLANHFYDEDDNLSYTIVSENVVTSIEGNILSLTPSAFFVGNATVKIIADDTEDIVSDDFVIVFSEPEDITVSISTLQGKAIIFEDVSWQKTIIVVNGENYNKNIDVNVTIPFEAENISASVEFNIVTDIDKTIMFTASVDALSTEEYSITYLTPGPVKTEEILNAYSKKIIVSSVVSYSDILAYTDLQFETPINNINFIEVENITYFDTNNNSLIDRIEWISSLGEFELSIDLLNIEYSNIVDDNWEIGFTSITNGNLTIELLNATFSEVSLDNVTTLNDLEILSLQCGNFVYYNKTKTESNQYFVSGNELVDVALGDSIKVQGIFVENYTCENTGYFVLRKLSNLGTLRFDFLGQEDYATADIEEVALDCSTTGCLYIKDNCGCNRAVFNGLGSVFIDGSLTKVNVTEGNDFIIEKDGIKLSIDDITGNMFVFGSVFENQINLQPSGNDDFIIENREKQVNAYLDGLTGNLYLKGTLQQNYFAECIC